MASSFDDLGCYWNVQIHLLNVTRSHLNWPNRFFSKFNVHVFVMMATVQKRSCWLQNSSIFFIVTTWPKMLNSSWIFKLKRRSSVARFQAYQQLSLNSTNRGVDNSRLTKAFLVVISLDVVNVHWTWPDCNPCTFSVTLVIGRFHEIWINKTIVWISIKIQSLYNTSCANHLK